MTVSPDRNILHLLASGCEGDRGSPQRERIRVYVLKEKWIFHLCNIPRSAIRRAQQVRERRGVLETSTFEKITSLIVIDSNSKEICRSVEACRCITGVCGKRFDVLHWKISRISSNILFASGWIANRNTGSDEKTSFSYTLAKCFVLSAIGYLGSIERKKESIVSCGEREPPCH